MNKSRYAIILGMLLLLCTMSIKLMAAEKIDIAMGYIPNVQFAPYYVAQEMGYFQDEGLEVSFDYGMSTDIMTLVAGGHVDFGISDADQVIIARDRSIPVKVVYTMYVKYPVGIVSFKERGLNTVSSLRGKKIGTPGPYGSNYIGLQVLLNSAGMGLDDIELVFIEYTQVESLLTSRVDAAVVFINNEPVLLRDMGREVNLIEAYRVTPMVSASVIVGERLLKRRPDVVRGFTRAVRRASSYIIENRDQVLPLIRPHVPTLTDSNMDINRKVLFASIDLWMDEDIDRYGLGYTTVDDWRQAIDTLFELGMIDDAMDPADCFTNDLLD